MNCTNMATNFSSSETALSNQPPKPDPFTIEAKIGFTAVYILIFTLSVFGNSIGLYVVCSKAPSRRITDLLIKNLAIADLIFTFTNLPLVAISFHLTGPFVWIGGIFGDITCKLISYAIPVSIAASVITLVVISFDRLCAIYFPLSQLLFHRHRIITGIIWLVALITMTPNLLLHRVSDLNGINECIQEWPWADDQKGSFAPLRMFHVIAFIVMYAFPLLVIAVSNSLIAYRIWFHKAPGVAGRRLSNVSVRSTRRKVVKLLMVVVIVFAISWLPTYVLHYYIFFQYHLYKRIPLAWVILLFCVSHSNCAINPLLFIAFNKNFRHAFLDTTVALSFLPCRAVNSCVAYFREERSTIMFPDQSYPSQPSEPRLLPVKMGARNGAANIYDTRL